jgi:hypothetical protein
MSRTVPQTPNNAFTPSAISVATSTGFNQGDLVYQSNTGNFGRIPDNAVSSDNFNVSQNSPIMATPANGGAVLASNTTGSSYGISAATLTDGNIVSVYVAQTANNVAFKITDVNNTVVVAQTIVSTVFRTNLSNISVAALSGGGFVVTWINTLAGGTVNSVCYAVYTNTGAVTLAAAQDLTLGSGTFTGNVYLSYALALPNGTFVLAAPNGSNVARYRIYNADGTGAYAATAGTGTYVPSFPVALAARSDSSFIIAGCNSGSTVSYSIISATNTAITSASFTSTLAPTTIFGLSIACLTNGTTFVIGYSGTAATSPTNSAAYRFLPTGNSLSTETLFTNGISSSASQPIQSVAVQSLSSGNFILLASENAGLINYAVFNSSGVCISGTGTAGAAIPKRIWAGQVRRTGNWNTVIVTSASINVYWTYATDQNSGTFGLVQSLVRLDLNTYDPIPVIGISRAISTTTAGVSGYNIGTATPTNAKFSASSTSLATSTQSLGYVRNETVINSNSCYALHSASLNNGNFVVVYVSRTSPYPITAAIYTSAGALVTSFFVSANGVTANSSVKVAALTGGGFVVTYATGASSPFTLNNSVYNSSGSLVGTSVATTFGHIDDSQWGFSVAGITNNRFVVLYSSNNSTQLSFRVFDSSGVALTAESSASYTGQKPTIAGYPAGGFAISYYATNQQIARFNEVATNTFNPAASYNFPVAQANAVSYAQLAVNSNNQAAMIGSVSGASGWYMAMPYDVSGSFWNLATSASQFSTSLASSPAYSCCFTAYGNVVVFNTTSSPQQFTIYPVGVNGNTGNITTTFQPSGLSFATSASEAQTHITPLYGNVVLCTYKDTSNIPKFFILNATPYTATQIITAGVTASNGIALGQPMGYSLAGVAATTATAGGIGQIQTNGIATLNSSYNASTPAQSFDFQNNTGVGVKGTITGRSVTLQGNV